MRTNPHSRRPRRTTARFFVEQLEDRSLPSAYKLAILGTLSGVGSAEANDINDAGQVVGVATSPSLNAHAFLWTNGVMTDLGTLAGPTSTGLGLNDTGQVVGYAAASGTVHAFLWQGGVMTDLTPGPQSAQATAVNDFGQVVGRQNPSSRIFLWEDGVFTDLGSLGGPGIAGGYAFDINNAGQVVGSSFTGEISDGLGQHAYLWQDGVMTDLGVLPGTEDSRAHAINSRGQAVGFSSLFDPKTTDEFSRSFLYSGSVMTDLNVPGVQSAAEDINDSGQIVGWMNSGGQRAYIYEDGVVTNLNTLIRPGSGFTLLNATGINNAGQIVGRAFGGGRFHAFLLTPMPVHTPVSIDNVTVILGGRTDPINSVFIVPLPFPAAGAGTTSAGSDDTAPSGTATFAPDDLTATVSVAVDSAVLTEPVETFPISLSQSMGAVLADG